MVRVSALGAAGNELLGMNGDIDWTGIVALRSAIRIAHSRGRNAARVPDVRVLEALIDYYEKENDRRKYVKNFYEGELRELAKENARLLDRNDELEKENGRLEEKTEYLLSRLYEMEFGAEDD